MAPKDGFSFFVYRGGEPINERMGLYSNGLWDNGGSITARYFSYRAY